MTNKGVKIIHDKSFYCGWKKIAGAAHCVFLIISNIWMYYHAI